MNEFRKMRRFKQEITREECIEVLKKAPRGVMAFHGENGYPYAIPLNQHYDERDGKVYFHGAREGLKLDLIKADNKVCFTVMDEGFVREGEWALNIKSVVCLGTIDVVKDPKVIEDQCRLLAGKFYPDEESVEAEIKASIHRVNMLCMTIERMTGKIVNES